MMNWTLLKKLASMVVLTLILLIPLMMVEGQIRMRGMYQQHVEWEVARTAFGEQTLAGPVLAVRYRVQKPPEAIKDEKTGKTVSTRLPPPEERVATLPAEQLAIEGEARMEERQRGIYPVRLYHLEMLLKGNFRLPADFLSLKPEDGKLLDARAVLLLGVTDLRGIGNDPEADIDGQKFHFGKPKDDALAQAIPGSRLEMELGRLTPNEARSFAFSFPLKLSGMSSFSFAPTALSNSLKLTSTWPHPNFQGSFLPQERHVDAAGFEAKWLVSSLNLNDRQEGGSVEVLSVDFIEPVSLYLQSERAIKYGILFIVLTFTAFFLWEILRRQPLHAMQYLLVGLALTIFFLLLIALSEHIAFLYAYLLSAAACIGLIVFYLAGVLGGRKPALAFGGGLVILYGALYSLLQSEDNALLIGSGMLFVALAAIMISTRRLNWHKLGNGIGKGNNYPYE
ncbi:MAG: cell envelope integrity protein CreD [Zoogloeaceae bacterium]|jgi:inner membrane protein|nr:cell envelope integrity protein CreD [Zoogloeaceae bacterium]